MNTEDLHLSHFPESCAESQVLKSADIIIASHLGFSSLPHHHCYYFDYLEPWIKDPPAASPFASSSIASSLCIVTVVSLLMLTH